jgi:EAL domain-containing protein (putative c-di-GMP-specific phosphodiesterase class I)
MSCSDCEAVPSFALIPGRVAAFADAGHVLAKARTVAAAQGAQLHVFEQDVAVLDFPEGRWAPFLKSLAVQTTQRERETLRFAPLPAEELRGLALARAAFSAPTAEAWCARAEFGWVTESLAARTLRSHYQPIVDTDSGELHAYEALLRGQYPDGAEASAGVMIEGARRLDVLFALDQQARESALLNAPPRQANKLFINFLPTVIYDPARCLATTWRALKQTTYRPEDVVFEVVESESIANRRDLIRILDHYREQKFRIALDDLGSGYASINLLGELRPDYVKLDMDLVRGAPNDSLRSGLIRAITHVARDCGIEVIAEGIETLEQARCVQDLGVHLMQGFHFARPAARPELAAHVFEGMAVAHPPTWRAAVA